DLIAHLDAHHCVAGAEVPVRLVVVNDLAHGVEPLDGWEDGHRLLLQYECRCSFRVPGARVACRAGAVRSRRRERGPESGIEPRFAAVQAGPLQAAEILRDPALAECGKAPPSRLRAVTSAAEQDRERVA